MNKFFNVHIEFNKDKVHSTIENAIFNNQKGYVCVIESNNLSIANKDESFNNIVNSSLINICDGSNIAWLLGKIYHQKFQSYVGNNIFLHYISQGKYRHYFIGNTKPVLDSLKLNLMLKNPSIADMEFTELPFRKVEEFDYESIAKNINKDNPDFIWVSLGAPKQEIFMSKLLPYLNRGVMLGVGAAFNFNSNSGNVKRAPLWMRKRRLEWLYRAFEEPQKNIPRYWNFLKRLPALFIHEQQEKKRKTTIR